MSSFLLNSFILLSYSEATQRRDADISASARENDSSCQVEDLQVPQFTLSSLGDRTLLRFDTGMGLM